MTRPFMAKNRFKYITRLIIAFLIIWGTMPSGPASSSSNQLEYLGPLPGGTLRHPFKFIVVADSHFGSGRGNRFSAKALDHIYENITDAAFIIHFRFNRNGFSGRVYDPENNMDKFNIQFFPTVGNHESRWQDPTSSIFKENYGNPSYSFDYGGFHL